MAFLLSGLWAAAQDGKVVTPKEVNPSGEATALSTPVADVVDGLASRPIRGKWYVGLGGGIDYNAAQGLYLCIAPDVSYKVNNALFVGAQASYSYYQHENLAGIIPYMRWHIVPLGKAISLYATAYAPVQFWKDYLEVGVRVRPGLAIRLSEGVYAMAGYGTVGYSFYNISGVTSKGRINSWDADTLEIGVLFSL